MPQQRATTSTGRRLYLLGDFLMAEAGWPVLAPANVERVVAYLAVTARPQPRTKVAGTLWADASETRAHARLRGALWRIAQVTPGWVLRDGNRLRLAEGKVSEARRQFFAFRDLIEETLGISPTDGLRELALDPAACGGVPARKA